MSERPVVAAVANYNIAGELARLLPDLASHGYDEIFILDDASTDGSREVVESLPGDFRFISRSENKGAGSNRNQVIPYLPHESLVHFLDADIILQSDRMADRVRDITPKSPFGFIGNLALTKNGTQNVWNYGPRQSLRGDIGAAVQANLEPLYTSDPMRALKIRGLFSKTMEPWPNPLRPEDRKQVYWCIEQSLIIDSNVLAVTKGFSEDLREHEIQDLAIRLARVGLKSYFDPSITIQHTEVEVRGYNRQLAMLRAEARINLKYGLRNWLLAR